MKRSTVIYGLVLILFGAAAPAAPADEENPAPQWTTDGLELVDQDRRGELYAAPGIDWTAYTEILLDRPTVAFRKNWQRDQNRYQSFKVRASDMESIRSDLADLFEEVFTRELIEEGGYVQADAVGENVMQLTPHIVDLDVYAPDTMSTPGRTESYTERAGRMTLKLAIHDSVTGDLIASAIHRQEAPRRGYWQWTTSVTNRAEARRMLERWARGLRERLDEARAAAPPGS